ncbi:MAG: VanZ family protein [Desulfobacterales bacterium]|nr:VanZ family protein [Desulfobacterales bacterium]
MLRTQVNPRLSRWLAVALYCIAIFIQSASPATPSLPAWPGMDKVLHFTAYALLGILFFRAYQTTDLNHKPVRLAVASILSAALYGLSDEIHQSFVPWRNAEALDLAADTLGALVAVLVWQFRVNGCLPSNSK